VNLYNELFWNIPVQRKDSLLSFSESQGKLLSSLTEKSGSVLVVEPGIPRSGEFISLLRSILLKENRFPLSPCTHYGPCPMPGHKNSRWCHFAFDTEDAPAELHKLSAAAKIPKERAVLSFLFAGPKAEKKSKSDKPEETGNFKSKVRVISDSFRLHAEKFGRYGCCDRGLVLVTASGAGINSSPSGALEELTLSGLKDEKSGALIAEKINHFHNPAGFEKAPNLRRKTK